MFSNTVPFHLQTEKPGVLTQSLFLVRERVQENVTEVWSSTESWSAPNLGQHRRWTLPGVEQSILREKKSRFGQRGQFHPFPRPFVWGPSFGKWISKVFTLKFPSGKCSAVIRNGQQGCLHLTDCTAIVHNIYSQLAK